MIEDFKRQKFIKKITDIFAFLALVDSATTYGIVIYIWMKQTTVLRDITSLICSIEIVCLLPISSLSSVILLKTRSFKCHQRLDAIGAWLLIQFINLFGNIGLIVSIVRPNINIFTRASFPLIAFIWWKVAFAFFQVISVIYSACVVLKPYTVKAEESGTRAMGLNIYTYYTDGNSNPTHTNTQASTTVLTTSHQSINGSKMGTFNQGYLQDYIIES